MAKQFAVGHDWFKSMILARLKNSKLYCGKKERSVPSKNNKYPDEKHICPYFDSLLNKSFRSK